MERFYLLLLISDHFWSSRAIPKKVKGNFSGNLGQNICRLSHLLTQLWVASRVTERLQIEDLRKLGYSKKVARRFVIEIECPACNFIKKWLQHRCFSVNFAKFLRALILQNHRKTSTNGCLCKLAKQIIGNFELVH